MIELAGALRLFWPAVVAGLAIALACGALSVFVVLRRLAFVGHGISHAAFGGVGVAAALGLIGGTAAGFMGELGRFVVVALFCIAAALAIAWSSGQGRGGRSRVGAMREDAAIGIALVGSMALGALLLFWRARQGADMGGASIEGWLFGSILTVSAMDAAAAWVVALAALGAVLVERRRLVFWAFDEEAAEAFGVSALRSRTALMLTLAVTIVAAMKLAGVILVTALLVIPGAAALRMSERLGAVFAWSIAVSVAGIGAGLGLSYRANLPPGPSVVVALVGLLALAWMVGWMRSARSTTARA